MVWRAYLFAFVGTGIVIIASIFTLLILGHSSLIGCPGSSVSAVIDCRAVLTSPGGRIAGVPLGGWALIWLGLFWLILSISPWVWIVSALGFLGVAYAVGTEMDVSHICIWCSFDQLGILILAFWGILGRRHAAA